MPRVLPKRVQGSGFGVRELDGSGHWTVGSGQETTERKVRKKVERVAVAPSPVRRPATLWFKSVKPVTGDVEKSVAVKPEKPEKAEKPVKPVKPVKPPRVKRRNDPVLIAAARELRDRWLEEVNTGAARIEASAARYRLGRKVSPECAPVLALPHAA